MFNKIYTPEVMQKEIREFPAEMLFSLARNDHASTIARTTAAVELLRRGDKRAEHIEVAPFTHMAVESLKQAVQEVSAAKQHVPKSPVPEGPRASVTTANFLRDEIVDNANAELSDVPQLTLDFDQDNV